EARQACEAHMRRALAGQLRRNDVTEHHGKDALCYDLKVEGGIPFPVFAQISHEFPGLTFVVDWVNVAAGERGQATFVSGRLEAQSSERVGTAAGSGHPVYVSVAADGKLLLAMTLEQVAGNEWRGYGVTATRDALLRVRRDPETNAIELHATEGAPEWAVAWTGRFPGRRVSRERLRNPIAIEDRLFEELDRLARDFAEAWIWFGNAPEQDIAIERERYSRYGYKSADANVRTNRLHAMRTKAGEGRAMEHSTFTAADSWLKDVVLATWARD
ncbi:MAG TPA: hypothetical protein VD839_13750, partial [Burkholderiales bacterium]|nr:hypothetical protein [Burkholderiales bacterium]